MPLFNSDSHTSSEHAAILRDEIIKELLDPLQPVLSPKMFMLGGQPGAGKKTIRDAITDNPLFKDALVIDPDDLREYHRKYAKFVKENPHTAAGRVHPDASKWAAELRAAAIKKKVNIVFDGTLGGNPSAAVKMAKEAAKGGFDVEVHVAAVSMEASQQGVRYRYEDAFEKNALDPDRNPLPRNVPDSIQESSYRKIPDAIEALAATGVVSRIRIADRGGKTLNDISGKFAVKKDGGKTLNEALEKERTRPWTPAEIKSFNQTGLTTEGRLQKRIDAETVDTEKQRLQKELSDIQLQREEVVNNKTAILSGKRKVQDAWIEQYTAFKFPKPAPSS